MTSRSRLRRGQATVTAAICSSNSVDALDIEAARLEELAATIHAGKRVSLWWTMGVNQSHEGVRTAQAIINLALMTGNIGRPGTGANSITGQCNAMGSRLPAMERRPLRGSWSAPLRVGTRDALQAPR